MAQVFLSWGSPNLKEMEALSSALTRAGVSVWQSKHGMEAADDPHDVVVQEIEQADIAVFLLSEAVIDRPWVRDELAWCFAKTRRDPQFQLLPFFVGPRPTQWPTIIQSTNMNVGDISALDDDALNRAVALVRRYLHLPEPIIVPAALFAMTTPQFDHERSRGSWRHADSLCEKLGMSGPLVERLLRGRYAETVDAFCPFGDGRTLKELVGRMTVLANKQKAAEDPPVLLRWCTADELQNSREVKKLWSSQTSLLFVDSVSLEVESIRNAVANLPFPRELTRSALVWIPPYSGHTATLEDSILASLDRVNWLQQAFVSFTDVADVDRAVAFDLLTPSGLNHWLLRLLGRPHYVSARSDARSAIRERWPASSMSPSRDFNRAGGR